MSRIRFIRVDDLWVNHTYAGFNQTQRAMASDYPYPAYAGWLDQRGYVEQALWIRTVGKGRVIHNYMPWRMRRSAGHDFDWHTVFIFDDPDTALAYKLRWNHPRIRRGPK